MQIKRIFPVLYYSFTLILFFLRTGNIKMLFLNLNDLRKRNKILNINLGNKSFLIRDLYDILALNEVFVDKVYNQLFTDLKKKTTFIDLGGYIGDTSIFASGFKNIDKIIVVEPFPANLNMLRKNIKLNNIKNINIIQSAVAKNKGTSTFFVHPNKGQNSLFKFKSDVEKIMVSKITLSEIIKMVHTKNIILKCDIEGAEYEVLMETSDGILKKFDKIIFEYHMNETKFKKVLNRLIKLGFNVNSIKHPVEPNLGNAFAFKNET